MNRRGDLLRATLRERSGPPGRARFATSDARENTDMNWKMWVPLVLAIVLGVVAATMARDVLNRNRAHPVQTRLAQVIVAKRPLQPGQALHADDLMTGEVSANSIPDGAFTAASDLDGRVVLVAMGKGQPIVQNLLAPQGMGSGLQALVPPGMRAITVSVDEFSGVGGMLLPGCRVDVLSTFQNENTGGHVARTIVQNVKVQAVGQRVTAGDPPPPQNGGAGSDGQPPQPPSRSVTLLATPEEAEAIELAAATGRPRLVLRSSGDTDTEARSGVSALDLSGKPNPPTPIFLPPPPATAPVAKVDPFATPDGPTTQAVTGPPPAGPPPMQTRTITVIRGGQESTVTFQVPPASSSLAGTDPKQVEGSH
jgi:pilus assembly protein CpaB